MWSGPYPDERTRHLYDDPVHVSAFVRSAASGSDIGPNLWLALSALFGTKALVVIAREDHWFIGNSSFPLVYPFVQSSAFASVRLALWSADFYMRR